MNDQMSQNNLVLSHDALHERCSSRSGIIAIGTRRRRRRQAVDGSQIHFRGGDGVIGSVNSQHSRAATVAAVAVQAEVVIRVAVEARSKPPATGTTTSLLWARTTKNTDCSTWPLARPFARSLAPLTRSLAPDSTLRSRPPLRSLVRSLGHFAHSLARGTVNDWMAIFSVSFFYLGP